MGLQRFPLGGFKGGMNLVDNPYALKSGEAQIATDVDLSLRDVLSSRRGFTSSGLSGLPGSTAFQFPDIGENFNTAEGLQPWTSPGNIIASDGLVASVNLGGVKGDFSDLAIARDFDIVLPGGAIPVGVEFEVKWNQSSEFSFQEFQVFLVRDNEVLKTENRAPRTGGYSSATPIVKYGGAEDLFGESLSRAQAESTGFGLAISIESSGGAPTFYGIDYVRAKVYYVVPTSPGITEHMRPWYTGNERLLVLSANGTVKRIKSSVITELFAGTAGTVWSFEQMEYNPGAGLKDSLWMMNGTDPAKKWDGTTFANWGGKPPKGTMLRVWKNRMIVSGHPSFPQRVFFSEIANPELPEDETNGGYGNNWIDIRTSEDDLDPVTWLEVIDDVLLVFKKKSVNAIYNSEDFSFTRIANTGCEGRFQSCVLDDRAYFVNRSGVYSVTAQGALRYESLNIEPLFKGTGPAGLEGINLNLLSSSGRMCALPNGRVYLACTPKGTTANRWLLECYPRLRGEVEGGRTPWVKHSFAKRCIKSMCTYRSKDEEVDKVVSGLTDEAGASPELVYLFDGPRDGLESITWRWVSGFKSMISEEPFERIRRLNLLMKGKLKARIISDGKLRSWKTLESGIEAVKSYRPEARGRYHALELTETSQTETFVYKGEFAIRGGKEHK